MKIVNDHYLNAMKASPCSPPTMWTPPSGIDSPRKNCRMSAEFADHGRFWSLMITLIVLDNTATLKCHPLNNGLCFLMMLPCSHQQPPTTEKRKQPYLLCIEHIFNRMKCGGELKLICIPIKVVLIFQKLELFSSKPWNW